MSRPLSIRVLEQKLSSARLKVEQLRLVCVAQRMVIDRKEAANAGVVKNLQGGINSHLNAWAIEHAALRDALAFFDRVSESKSEWTYGDIKRLAELRELAK